MPLLGGECLGIPGRHRQHEVLEASGDDLHVELLAHPWQLRLAEELGRCLKPLEDLGLLEPGVAGHAGHVAWLVDEADSNDGRLRTFIQALNPTHEGLRDPQACLPERCAPSSQLRVLRPERWPLRPDAAVGCVGGSSGESVQVQDNLQALAPGLPHELRQPGARDRHPGRRRRVERIGDDPRVRLRVVPAVGLRVEGAQRLRERGPGHGYADGPDTHRCNALQVAVVHVGSPVGHKSIDRGLVSYSVGQLLREHALRGPLDGGNVRREALSLPLGHLRGHSFARRARK
mmetsp:Transcript_72877/g.206813  ORF Transcript_72877/g.206813 Transcript_72877/m.206813 type:complete len:289 (+) Transcript_72877:837-1703(+)